MNTALEQFILKEKDFLKANGGDETEKGVQAGSPGVGPPKGAGDAPSAQ